jgi:hypothetical protein
VIIVWPSATALRVAAQPKDQQEEMIESAKKAASKAVDVAKKAARPKSGPQPQRRKNSPAMQEHIASLVMDQGSETLAKDLLGLLEADLGEDRLAQVVAGDIYVGN